MDIQKEREALQKLINEMFEVTGTWSVEDMVTHVWKATKAQTVSEVVTVGNELQSWVAVNSFSADDGEGVLPVVDANAIAEKIEELTGANQ